MDGASRAGIGNDNIDQENNTADTSGRTNEDCPGDDNTDEKMLLLVLQVRQVKMVLATIIQMRRMVLLVLLVLLLLLLLLVQLLLFMVLILLLVLLMRGGRVEWMLAIVKMLVVLAAVIQVLKYVTFESKKCIY